MICMSLTHRGVRLSASCTGERVSYTVSRQGKDLGRFLKFVPVSVQSFEMQRLSWVFGDFFGIEEESHA